MRTLNLSAALCAVCGGAAGLLGTGTALAQPGTAMTWGETQHCNDPKEPLFDDLYPPPPYSFNVVASGLMYNAGIDSDGHIHVWGGNNNMTALSQIPSGLFSQIGCGENFWVALRAPGEPNEGTVVQRGLEQFGNFGNIPGTDKVFKQISVGEYHAIGLLQATEKIIEWGGYEHTQNYPPNGPIPARFGISGNISDMTFKSVTAGAYSSGGILKSSDPEIDGRLIMWDNDESGQGSLVSQAPITGKFKSGAQPDSTKLAECGTSSRDAALVVGV